jgi:hypothetical protein
MQMRDSMPLRVSVVLLCAQQAGNQRTRPERDGGAHVTKCGDSGVVECQELPRGH